MKNQQQNACAVKTSIGGQALMEGIMMRGPKRSAMAVRNPEGKIIVEEFETKGAKRPAICRWPIIRGLFGYIDSMTIGYKCLMRSAEIAGLEDMVEEKPKKQKENTEAETATALEPEAVTVEENQAENTEKNEKSEEEKLPAWVMTVMMVASVALALVLGLGLFLYLPAQIFEWISMGLPFLKGENAALNSLYKSAFEGIIKIVLLVAYMAAISLMKDIRRTFMYHGAEHKTIFCYEAGLPLTVENIKKQKRFHPRCGTSFLIIMLLVSMFVSFFIDPLSILISGHVLPTILRVVVKLLLLPLIVGLGYELIKFAGRHDNIVTRIISAPGVWLQNITVFEPTDDMIECAIEAMKIAIPDDGSDAW